jgi:hypothetical protein
MAQAILRPSGIGTYNYWTLGAGASKPAAEDPGDPISHDNDTSYIQIGTVPGTNNQQSFYLNTGIPAAMAGVNQLDFKTRARNTDTPGVESWYQFLRLGATEGSSSSQIMNLTYANHAELAIARPGGGSWVSSDFVANNLQGAVHVDAASTQTARMTSIWCVLDYQPVLGGLLLPFLWALGPLSAVLFREMPMLARTVFRRTGNLITTTEEYLDAWRELREHTWPRFILPPTRGWAGEAHV